MILLGSFVEINQLPHERWSGARWAPSFATDWPVAVWASPIRPDGSPIRLRDFGTDPLPKYHEYMLDLYRTRYPAIKAWLVEVQAEQVTTSLACWCPFTRTAAAQLAKWKSFHCHLGVVKHVFDAMEVKNEFTKIVGSQLVAQSAPIHKSTNL